MIKGNIFIVTDDESARPEVTFLLKDAFPSVKVLQTGSFLEILKLVKRKKIDLLLLDINFRDGGILHLIPSIKKLQPDTKILFLLAGDEDIYTIRYLNVGANGYLSKLSSKDEIRHAINSVLVYGKYMSQNIQNIINNSDIFKKFQQLSNREFEIGKLLVAGVGDKVVADSLNIKLSAVRTYKMRIFDKLDINDLSTLIEVFNLYV
ncbi:response regulator transcription factor [Flavobacterium sp. CFS9]|uniref:Response regulator transcription factor n=1 Tax=Flavobacterium sp. CFS9 TaxID=3143118 RepID=A0AAT9H739_9FLAO